MAAGGAGLAPALAVEPHATSKHTLCGYAWGDVTNALIRAIGKADLTLSLRWSAELVCSELGLGRLEAILFHAWALHVGGANVSWCRTWYNTVAQLRAYWSKSGGDIKSVRNTPIVRQLVAEAVAELVLSAKQSLPELPKADVCFRESEGVRQRIKDGGGVGDQFATRRVWTAGQDGYDLRTLGNEMEAALRGNHKPQLLFWITWLITLDSLPDAPVAKERGPAHLSVKQRKSLLWFLIAVLKEIANDAHFLSVEERNGLFGTIELTWNKLGVRGRRDVIAAIALSLQTHMQRRTSLSLSPPPAPPTVDVIRRATASVDEIYSGIAVEARKFVVETPKMVGLTKAAEAAAEKPEKKVMSAMDKLTLSYALIGR